MGAVSGQLTTFNAPNYVGELFRVTPNDTPFVSMIGGLTGGKRTDSKQFSWQSVDNAAAAQPANLEGADVTYSERSRSEVYNVVQIYQEGVQTSYTKQAAVGNLAGQSILGSQPVMNEHDFQIQLKLEKIARDIEYTFLNGTYAFPADNVTARKTRGLISAVTTNTVAAGSADLSQEMIDELLREMVASGAPFRSPVLFAGAFNIQRLNEIYGYAPESRNVGGLAINQIVTPFAQLGIVFDRHMPADTVLIADVSVCAPVFLMIPGKGFLFQEEIAKTGSADKTQLYGEVGLEYGPEQWHGTITATSTAP